MSLGSTTVESPEGQTQLCIPDVNTDLSDVFSKTKATGLSPHCPAQLPCYHNHWVRVYPLSEPNNASSTEDVASLSKKGKNGLGRNKLSKF